MKKRLVSKALDMIGSIAKREETGEADYERFWSAFGQNLKLGLIEDQENRDKLAKLCRFYSSKSGDKLISLSDYVANMPESQSSIYFLAAESKELAGKAPFVENLIKRGYEVLYLLEPVDEVAITNLQKFDEKTFVDVSKEEIELEETEEEKKEQEKKDVEFQDLCTWIKSALGDNVQKVRRRRAVTGPRPSASHGSASAVSLTTDPRAGRGPCRWWCPSASAPPPASWSPPSSAGPPTWSAS
eukprot:scaffold310_cov302-Prasinococcus_capsulatus_cf.AAC.5